MPNTWRMKLKAAATRAGLPQPEICAYHLRHSRRLTTMVLGGVDIFSCRENFRHVGDQMIEQRLRASATRTREESTLTARAAVSACPRSRRRASLRAAVTRVAKGIRLLADAEPPRGPVTPPTAEERQSVVLR